MLIKKAVMEVARNGVSDYVNVIIPKQEGLIDQPHQKKI